MSKLQILPSLLFSAAAVFTASCKDAKVPYAQNDVLETPKLSDVKIEGAIGKKMDTFFRERVFSDYAKKEIFGEAESAFENPQDDAKKVVGVWQGEFWGKLAISGSRVAQYSGSADLAKFLESSADRLITHQQPDGYLGTYKDKMFLRVYDLDAAEKVMKWRCNWCWNIWCRKYTLWGLLEIYELGGNPKYLEAAKRSADQLIDMLRANNVRICDTGTFEGMPSMSILKPMLILYRNTGDKKFLDFSREIVGYLDRDDGTSPNLIRNSFSDKPVHEWYPQPEKWAKAYEMMSCMEGGSRILPNHGRQTLSRCGRTFCRQNLEVRAQSACQCRLQRPVRACGLGNQRHNRAVRRNPLDASESRFVHAYGQFQVCRRF